MLREMSDDRAYIVTGVALLVIFVVAVFGVEMVTDTSLVSDPTMKGFVFGYLLNLAVFFTVFYLITDVERSADATER
ncbi:MAG: hypothetical protein ACOCT0_03790 [Halobacteriota archaeon]